LCDDLPIFEDIVCGSWKGVVEMEIGGLMAYAFKVIFGNPDVMVLISTFTISIALGMVIARIYDDLR
jgi:hypothetical protein